MYRSLGCGVSGQRQPRASDSANGGGGGGGGQPCADPDPSANLLGPMAYSMMGGIIAGTVMTLFFLPALYLAVFEIKPPDRGQ